MRKESIFFKKLSKLKIYLILGKEMLSVLVARHVKGEGNSATEDINGDTSEKSRDSFILVGSLD